jgi:L-fucose isomerase-like protein
MHQSQDLKPKIGLISITDTPRALAVVEEREEVITKKHNDFKKYLEDSGIEVVDASEYVPREKRWVSFYSSEDIQKAVDIFLQHHIEAVIVGCWHWSEPMFVVEIARSLNKPILLYAEEDPAWAATCLLSAAGASLWETCPNRAAQVHERIYGDRQAVLKWVKGTCALEKMKKGTVVLWGGSYALRMEYLQDDFPRLKSFLIGDIMIEDQYVLIKYAEQILEDRIDKFIDWLKKGGTRLNFDDKVFTPEVLRNQIELYLAAKDRINEIGGNIIGASVKCFNELSDIYGVDPCFLPAFVPYTEDSEGKKKTVPTVCEGDIKGLLSSIMLTIITGGIPSLFGDITYIGKDYFIISNCGASSVYYACKSCVTCEMLKALTIEANCEGVSGGAVGYKTPPGRMTVARLTRSKGKYFMHLGLAEAIKITKDIESKFYYGKTWPHTALNMDVDQQLLVKALGSNHIIATPGDFIKEINYLCNQAGIEVFRIDSKEGIEKWLERVSFLDQIWI